MELLESLNVIEDQTWLDPTGDQVQKVVTRVLTHENPTGKRLDDLLNGVWLGHPLHPVLTDIPIGAWGGAGLRRPAARMRAPRPPTPPGHSALLAEGAEGKSR